MAHIYCGSCNGHHAYASGVRACYAARNIQKRDANKPRTALPPRRNVSQGKQLKVIHTSDPVSPPQLDGIKRRCRVLNLDFKTVLAQVSTKGEASAVITTLDQRIKTMGTEPTRVVGRSTPIIGLPPHMIRMVKPGRYAVRENLNEPYKFFRMSCPTTGKRAGVYRIQTQHGDNLRLRLEILPSGRITSYDSAKIGNLTLPEWITQLIPEQAEAAIAYGRELEQCCKCGIKLTDEESRYYGIGPECTKKWPWIHEMVVESKGEYVA